MKSSLLFGGWTTLIPIFLTLVGVGFVFWVGSFAHRSGWTVKKRIGWLYRLRNLIPMLPLSGLFGTIWSLIDTLSFMDQQGSGASADISKIVTRFAPALSSTLWGILGAFVLIVLAELSLHQLEEDDA
jgi:biopolymer transport protein ExbB/TolQ